MDLGMLSAAFPWIALLGGTTAFSHPLLVPDGHHRGLSTVVRPMYSRSSAPAAAIRVRGGREKEVLFKQETRESEQLNGDDSETPSPQVERTTVESSRGSVTASVAAVLPMAQQLLQSLGQTYAASLRRNPILTKSVTSGCIFAVSDLLAQRLEKTATTIDPNATLQRRSLRWSRTLTSAALGFFYFGPAAHFWYEWIFRALPGTSLPSTLQKAVLGQAIFGPSFTCLFFATSLLQSGTFTFRNWFRKIRTDLPGAWLAGAGFWPIVDLISYSLIAPLWIPLFVNVCSLVWTTYLILESYK